MIERLRLKDFRRYDDETFTFSAGLNVVEGRNNAGKTTLLYAIEYALFGRIGGFASPSALMSPKAKAMGVEMVFRGRDGLRYRLQRVHIKPPRSRTKVVGHFTLKVQDEGEDEERYLLSSEFNDHEEALRLALHKVLGVTRRNFDVAVCARQGELTRILAGAPELDAVLGVTAAVASADEMRSMALEREKAAAALPVLEEGLARMTAERLGWLETTQALGVEQTKAEAEITQLDAALGARRDAIAEDAPLVDALGALRTALRGLDAARPAAETARQILANFHAEHRETPGIEAEETDELERLALERTQLVEDAKSRAETRSTLDQRLGDLRGRIHRREHLPTGTDATCESCGQTIDPEFVAKELPALHAERTELEGELAELTAGEAAAADALRRVDARVASLRQAAHERSVTTQQAQRLQAAVEAAEGQLAGAEAAVASQLASAQSAAAAVTLEAADAPAFAQALDAAINARQADARADIARLSAELSAAKSQQQRVLQQLTTTHEAIARVDRDMAGDTAKADALRDDAAAATRLRALAAAFKDLQRALRERATIELATLTHTLHRALAGGDTQLKAVTIDPARYTVMVTPTDVGREVPAALYQGGGHRALLGLAFKLAVAQLVGASPFILLDEPTDGLDAEHRSALLRRILDLGLSRQMILITHHDVGDLPAQRLRVARAGKRSHLDVAS